MVRRQFRGSMGSDGFEKVLIGTLGPRETLTVRGTQPILAQLLRTLKSHPGVVVRFEGHVNSTCDVTCRGATDKPCAAARKVGSDMCTRCPGGAYGLSKARAGAIKNFVAKSWVDVDRVYAVGFAGTRRLSDDITEEKGAVNRRVEVHMMPYAPPGRL